jgi:hypothetical protein
MSERREGGEGRAPRRQQKLVYMQGAFCVAQPKLIMMRDCGLLVQHHVITINKVVTMGNWAIRVLHGSIRH